MLRNDGKYIIYIIKHLWKDDSTNEWARSGECTNWIPHGKQHKHIKDIFKPFSASGVCWQMTGVHGSFHKNDAIKILDHISKWNPGHRYKICKVTINQVTKTIAEKKFEVIDNRSTI